jgi:hypothetical protein
MYNDPEQWRKHADECRKFARYMIDRDSKKAMLEIADRYDRFAKRSMERIPGAPKTRWRVSTAGRE